MEERPRKKGYTGVSYDRTRQKWRVKFTYKGITYLDTTTETEREGVKMRDLAIIKHNLKLPLQILTKLLDPNEVSRKDIKKT
jgi:hypothetical protein